MEGCGVGGGGEEEEEEEGGRDQIEEEGETRNKMMIMGKWKERKRE